MTPLVGSTHVPEPSPLPTSNETRLTWLHLRTPRIDTDLVVEDAADAHGASNGDELVLDDVELDKVGRE